MYCSFLLYCAKNNTDLMLINYNHIITILNRVFLGLFFLLFLSCSQLDIEPNETTHEDYVKENMRDGQARHTNILDEDKGLSLRQMVLGDDAASIAIGIDLSLIHI